NKPEDARAHYAQAASAYSLIGDRYTLALVQQRLAALNATSSPADSRPLAEAALATFQHLNAGPDARRTRKLLRSWPRIVDSDLARSEADVGSIVARAAISVDLVAEAWLQAAEKLAPDRWLVVREYVGNGQWKSIHSHGDIPSDLRDPDPAIARACGDGVDWMRLRGAPGPVFFFGMECGGDDDPACRAIEQRLLPWIPVVGLALEHALLRSARLGRAGQWDDLADTSFDGVVYSNAQMRDVIRQIRRIHSSRSPVLIAGEHGVGKKLIARLIHDTSDRRESPFVIFSCANLQGDIIDRQLFGHAAEGSAISAAAGGTLLIDEVSVLSVESQQKLLRFLESGEAVPFGRG
ncbi:MAG: sigma 54-interacting transcriptional regulator, partial [Rhodothermales bacterium]